MDCQDDGGFGEYVFQHMTDHRDSAMSASEPPARNGTAGLFGMWSCPHTRQRVFVRRLPGLGCILTEVRREFLL